MKSTLALASALLVAGAATAVGQPTPAEERWLEHVSKALGRPSSPSFRDEQFHEVERMITARIDQPLGEPSASKPRPAADPRVLSVRSTGQPSLVIERMRFSSAERARRFVTRFADGSGSPTRHASMFEARGNQVVVVEGEEVRDPDRLQVLREIAWGGLKKPSAAHDALIVNLGEREQVYAADRRHADAMKPIDSAVEAARRARGRSGTTVSGEADDLRVTLAGGPGSTALEARLVRDDRGGKSWIARKDQAAAVEKFFDQLFPTPSQDEWERPVVAAAERVEDSITSSIGGVGGSPPPGPDLSSLPHEFVAESGVGVRDGRVVETGEPYDPSRHGWPRR